MLWAPRCLCTLLTDEGLRVGVLAPASWKHEILGAPLPGAQGSGDVPGMLPS